MYLYDMTAEEVLAEYDKDSIELAKKTLNHTKLWAKGKIPPTHYPISHVYTTKSKRGNNYIIVITFENERHWKCRTKLPHVDVIADCLTSKGTPYCFLLNDLYARLAKTKKSTLSKNDNTIVQFGAHFFSRYKERCGLQEVDKELRKHFFKYNLDAYAIFCDYEDYSLFAMTSASGLTVGDYYVDRDIATANTYINRNTITAGKQRRLIDLSDQIQNVFSQIAQNEMCGFSTDKLREQHKALNDDLRQVLEKFKEGGR